MFNLGVFSYVVSEVTTYLRPPDLRKRYIATVSSRLSLPTVERWNLVTI